MPGQPARRCCFGERILASSSAGTSELQVGSSGRLLSSRIGHEFPEAFRVEAAGYRESLEKLCHLRLGLKRRVLPNFSERLGEKHLLLLSHSPLPALEGSARVCQKGMLLDWDWE